MKTVAAARRAPTEGRNIPAAKRLHQKQHRVEESFLNFLNVTKVTSRLDSRERNNHSLGVGGMRRVGCSKENICHMNSSRGINSTFASFPPLVFSFISFLFPSHTSSADWNSCRLAVGCAWAKHPTSKSQLIEQV